MKKETLEDILNEFADMLDCYGACKHDGSGDGCEHSKDKLCCRVGFFIEYEDRIRNAITNEEQLNEIPKRKSRLEILLSEHLTEEEEDELVKYLKFIAQGNKK